MKKLIFVFLGMVIVISSLLASCGDNLVGSGSVETKEYSFSEFTKVNISSAFEFEISQSDSYAISITADENLMKRVQVSKSGDTLKISLGTTTGMENVTLKTRVTMPVVTGLDIFGAAHGTVTGFNSSENLNIVVSGNSTVKGDITAGNTSFDISETSTLELEGTAGDMYAEVSGTSHFNLEAFLVNDADITFTDCSTGTVNVNGVLNVDIKDSSKLFYMGEPTLGDIKIRRATSISKK